MIRLAIISLPVALAACGQPDKAAHFAVGAGVSVVAKQVWPDSPLAPCLASLGVGVAKEVWDRKTGRGTPETMDAMATGVGCVVTVEF